MPMDCVAVRVLELISLSMLAPLAPMLHIPRSLPLWESYYLQLALLVVAWLVRKSLNVSLLFKKKEKRKKNSVLPDEFAAIPYFEGCFQFLDCSVWSGEWSRVTVLSALNEFIESIASKSQRVNTKKQRERISRQTARLHQSRYLSAQQRQLG